MSKIRTLFLIFGLIFISTISFAQNETAYLSYYPKVEYNAKVAESNTSDDGTILEKIVIDGFDSRVPFYSIKPEINKTDQFVILLHGITGSKENWVNPTSSLSTKYVKLKDSLLSIGYNVIIPDAKYHGERSYEADFASPILFYATQDLQRIQNLWSTSVKDIRVIMDYMQSLPNGEQITFDVVGYSMGGLMAIYLNSVDDRLNRIVACVAPIGSTLKAGMSLGLNEENAKKMKERFSSEIYAPMQKAPITLLMGAKDGWYTEKEAQDFYDNIAIKAKSLKFYESGHYLPEEFISDVITSLNKK
ncbi:alpha/beta hydrolase [Cellulophaga sp. F20128]|uniref:alpha/beta hydrolase n=1 Tax=Cellulophaga sp. F20128 TaxID=2926413 RepID=UPI001FF4919A|nr:alpha/beta fold hydrolase [Cellulophaga sp. F20128]MCK0158148.1 alpha/beta hydrolase [Cellulophaga sp. F20128]